ncbi:MAG: 4-hydroxybenzoate octaprenyltransferase [Gammaproteobacteria bacterium]|nr:4-hydroxybenzoate octaprenyltransferase [Gammaproteobacteria bacterium]
MTTSITSTGLNRALIRHRSYYYALLMRLNRPIGTYLLLWPTVWALWIAGQGQPHPGVTLVFVLGVILMRSAGCVINDYADRDFDPHVARTRNRPIAAGQVSPREALVLFAVLCLLAFALVLTLNTLTILLSLGGALLAGIYPFMKRYTYLPQVFLGLAFGWAVPMAFAAQTGGVPLVAWLLLTATVLWATAYDSMYAMVDIEDDLKIGVKSTAILFGDADRIVIGSLQCMLLLTLWIVGNNLGLGLFYFLGLGVAAGLSVYQQFLIRDRSPEGCFKAFLNNHWFGAAIFAGLVLHYGFTTPAASTATTMGGL